MPYAVIGVLLVLLAIMIGSFNLPKVEDGEYRLRDKVSDSIWKHPNLLLGAIGIFTYVGAEVSIGSFLVNYFGLPDIASLSAKTAAGYVSLVRDFCVDSVPEDYLPYSRFVPQLWSPLPWHSADTRQCGLSSQLDSSTRLCFPPSSAWVSQNLGR